MNELNQYDVRNLLHADQLLKMHNQVKPKTNKYNKNSTAEFNNASQLMLHE